MKYDFETYTTAAKQTAIYPRDRALEYLALGLTSEAGEVAGKIKKVLRDEDSWFTDESHTALLSELGDVLWYLAMMAEELCIPLGWVAAENISKLKSRHERGVIGGSGDAR